MIVVASVILMTRCERCHTSINNSFNVFRKRSSLKGKSCIKKLSDTEEVTHE